MRDPFRAGAAFSPFLPTAALLSFRPPSRHEEAKRSSPDAAALAAPGHSPATYRQLAINAWTIAGQLKEMGIGRTDRVAVVLPNGPEMATTFLAVSMGAICAPLNPGYRQNEFDFLLSDL